MTLIDRLYSFAMEHGEWVLKRLTIPQILTQVAVQTAIAATYDSEFMEFRDFEAWAVKAKQIDVTAYLNPQGTPSSGTNEL